MNATVTKLPTSTTTKTTPSRKPSSKAVMRANQQQYAAHVIIGVALVLACLSLTDLSSGIALVTRCATWQAWALAVGIDMGFVAMELATMAVTSDKLRKRISKYTRPSIIATMCGSACLNALAFAWNAEGYVMQAGAVALGLAIPAMVYILTRVGAEMVIDQRQGA